MRIREQDEKENTDLITWMKYNVSMDKMLIDNYLVELVENIKTHNPLEIILFGSLAQSTYTSESDIDLLIILDLDRIPESYEEKMQYRSAIRKSIREINKRVAIDLLVFTRKEIEIMKDEKSAFWEEIDKTGKVMYEKAS